MGKKVQSRWKTLPMPGQGILRHRKVRYKLDFLRCFLEGVIPCRVAPQQKNASVSRNRKIERVLLTNQIKSWENSIGQRIRNWSKHPEKGRWARRKLGRPTGTLGEKNGKLGLFVIFRNKFPGFHRSLRSVSLFNADYLSRHSRNQKYHF